MGKLGGISSTEDSWKEKYIRQLEAENASLQVDKKYYRDVAEILRAGPEEAETFSGDVYEKIPKKIESWSTARKKLSSAARYRKEIKEKPIARSG